MFPSAIFHGEDAAKKLWRHGAKMSHHGTRDAYFTQSMAEFMAVRHAILEIFNALMRFQKMLSESAGLPASFGRMSLHAFMKWVHFTLLRKEAVKMISNRTHWGPRSNLTLPYRNRKQWV